jgi:flagellar basal-body rod protein FlgB
MSGIQQFDTTMRLLQKVLDLRQANGQVIGSNIANAETPGYSAQTYSFEQQLHSALGEGGLRPVTTQANHIPLSPANLEQVQGSVSVTRDKTGIGDENSVSVDQEMVKLSENEILYEAAVTMLNKKIAMVKYVTNGGS